MKIILKNKKTLEGDVTLPPKPEEELAKIVMLADGPMEEPSFEGGPEGQGDSVPVDPENPVTYPDIIIHQQVADFAEYLESAGLFENSEDYSTLEVEDEGTQETRTFDHVSLCGIQYVPTQFVWNEDGHGGIGTPSENLFVDIYLRGLETETE